MEAYEVIHVAIAPPSMLEADLVEKVTAIVNRDRYGTRLLLAGQLPRIIAHCQGMQVAESMAQRLRDLGLLVIVCEDSELHKPLQSFQAYTMEFREGEVVFWNKGGHERRMESSDVFLIIKGRKHTYIEEEKTNTKMKFSLPATVLTGGIPIWRKVREQTRDTSLRSEYFLRLYDRESPETSVEILQEHMNYSFLGEMMAFSSLANFNILAAKLREVFPQAIFDDRPTKSPEMNVSPVKGQDELETKLRLIYLCHVAQSGLDR
jgi:hypothetical protein